MDYKGKGGRKTIMKRKILYQFVFFCVMAFAVACSDDHSSKAATNNDPLPPEVEELENLGECSQKRLGEIVRGAESDSLYECTEEGWVPYLEDSEPKSSSSMVIDSKDTVNIETVVVDSVSVKGFAQKGPLVSGSVVTVTGLDSVLKETKKTFSGKVEGTLGAFSVNKVSFESQYALVSASGYHTSEITGKKTVGSKTKLYALVDLSSGKEISANVNVLTTLEYYRAKFLVANKKMNVPAAKRMATRELMDIFGASASDSLVATSVSLADTNDAGKALYFSSILLQGDLGTSKFAMRLSKISEYFAANGSLDSAAFQAELADWASRVDSADNYESIRENVKNLKLAATVPNFEKSLYEFWTSNYKLGVCNDSLEEAQAKNALVKKNENEFSENFGTGYICSGKRWHKATKLDTELGRCLSATEGTYKDYKKENATLYYVCKAGKWEEISEMQFALKECSEKREDEYALAKEKYFVCKSKQWNEISALDYELKLCSAERELELALTKNSEAYVCEAETWRKALDIEKKFGVCGSKIVPDSTFQYDSNNSKYYLCKDFEWNEISEKDFVLKKCDELKEGNYEKVDGEYFICQNSLWKEISAVDYEFKLCTERRFRETKVAKDSKSYVCDKIAESAWAWRELTELEATHGVCGASAELENKFVEFDSGYFVCKNSEWLPVDYVSYAKQILCDAEHEGVFEELNGKYYACKEGEWNQIDYVEFVYGFCVDSRNGEYVGDAEDGSLGYYYKCNAASKKWEKVSYGEFMVQKECSESAGTDSTIQKGFACVVTGTKYEWRKAGEGEKAVGEFCKPKSNTVIKNGYVCDYTTTNSGWRVAYDAEMETGLVCGSANATLDKGSFVTSADSTLHDGYICVKKTSSVSCESFAINGDCWRVANDAEKKTGTICKSDFENYVDKENGYTCRKIDGVFAWDVATEAEKATGKVCTYVLANQTMNGYSCKEKPSGGYQWYKASAGEKVTGIVCTETVAAEKKITKDYVCELDLSNYRWRKATASEVEVGVPCNEENDKRIHFRDSLTYYRCDGEYSVNDWEVVEYGILNDTRPKVYDGEKRKYRTVTTYTIDRSSTITMMVDNLSYANVPYWYCYRSDAKQFIKSCEDYGMLYSWSDALGIDRQYNSEMAGSKVDERHRGICPNSYHVPSKEEIEKIKLTEEYGFITDNAVGSLESDFLATPYWWTSYEGSAGIAYNLLKSTRKSNYYYLRCFKD